MRAPQFLRIFEELSFFLGTFPLSSDRFEGRGNISDLNWRTVKHGQNIFGNKKTQFQLCGLTSPLIKGLGVPLTKDTNYGGIEPYFNKFQFAQNCKVKGLFSNTRSCKYRK